MIDSKLRIVISMVDHPDQMNGAVRLAFDEALFLDEQGHDVWVVCPDTSRSHPEYARVSGVHVLCYPQPNTGLLSLRRLNIHQKQTVALVTKYVRGKVDVIHGHSLLQYNGMLSMDSKIARRCYSMHSPVRLETQASAREVSILNRWRLALASRLLDRVEHQCLAASDCITTDSEYTRSLLSAFHGELLQNKTMVIPGWVDTGRFDIISDRQNAKTQLGWPIDIPVLFTLRRLVPRMGLDRLLMACHEVSSAGLKFQLIVGGSGPLRTQLEAQAAKLNLQDSISFVGFVAEDLLPMMYGAADVFVLPTTALECFGLIVLEALACGTPVLATPVGAIPEILSHFEPQWLARSADTCALTDLLVAYLRNELPNHAPVDLRNKVMKEYSREKIVPQLISAALRSS